MATTGKKLKSKERTEQSKNGELGLIIDEFGRAMWNAHRPYIAETRTFCPHAGPAHFTLNMQAVWYKYVEFCKRNPK